MTRCELCKSFGPTKIKYDVDSAREHAKTHFRQLIIVDDQVSENQVFEKCFPENQPMVARRGPQRAKSSSRQILVDLCHSLFPRNRALDSSSHMACAKCGVQLIVRKSKRLDTGTIIDHACSHLDEKELYACHHCSQRYKTFRGIKSHVAKVHRITSTDGHFENKCHHFVKEISLQIESCFGPNNKEVAVDRKWAVTASKIRRIYKGSELSLKRQLLSQQLIRKIIDGDQCVQCRLCSTRLSVKTRYGYSSRSAMYHVLHHLQEPTMQCRICSDVFVSRYNLQDHLKNIHSLPLADNYDSLADDFHVEISSLLEKCFGTSVHGDTIGVTIAPRSERAIRQAVKGSELAIERNLLCHRLMLKFANHEQRVQCHLCSNWINIKHVGESCTHQPIMWHALRHLAKPLFRCKQCSTPYTSSRAMSGHLRQKHALPFENNHVCSQDEYHSDILTILRECYGDERNGVKLE